MEKRIVQIMPATGWRVAVHAEDVPDKVEFLPVACFALEEDSEGYTGIAPYVVCGDEVVCANDLKNSLAVLGPGVEAYHATYDCAEELSRKKEEPRRRRFALDWTTRGGQG